MPLPAIIAAGAAIGAVASGVTEVVGNHSVSGDNRSRGDDAAAAGEQKYSGDRDAATNEWAHLSNDFDGEFAPTAATKEAFKTWTHQQIWEALQGSPDGQTPEIVAAEVSAGADGWRQLTADLFTDLDTFGKNVERVIDEKWGGHAANAAVAGTRTFVTESKQLPRSFEMVANGIDQVQGYLAQSKTSIVPPVEVSGFDEFVGHIPGNGVVKAAKHRANEAQAQAQDLMIDFYQPGVTTVDGQTPVFTVTKNPVADGPGGPGNQPSPVGSGLGQDTGTDNPGSSPTGPNPTAPEGQGAPNQEGPANPATDPAGAQPTDATTPSNTAPTTPSSTVPTEEPVGRPNSTTPGGPGMAPTGGPTGNTPGGPAAPPAPGRSIEKPPSGQPPQGNPAGKGAGNPTGVRGMGGAPMAGAGAPRGKNDDEDEHKTPDYLVQDRTTELLGEQPRVLPPGGVIG